MSEQRAKDERLKVYSDVFMYTFVGVNKQLGVKRIDQFTEVSLFSLLFLLLPVVTTSILSHMSSSSSSLSSPRAALSDDLFKRSAVSPRSVCFVFCNKRLFHIKGSYCCLPCSVAQSEESLELRLKKIQRVGVPILRGQVFALSNWVLFNSYPAL